MDKQIELAVQKFRELLYEQIERAQTIKNKNATYHDNKSKKITVGIIDGDGIGPIIMKQTQRILELLLKEEISSKNLVLEKIEGLTISERLRQECSVPNSVLAKIRECDVILKGPTETPKGGKLESANVTLRRELDLYANVRPVSIPEEGIDWTFFRENTEGEYVLGSKGIEIEKLLCMDFKVTTYEGTKRIAKAAFDFARKNGKQNVSIVTKANIMKKTDGIFSAICNEVAKDYPEIEAEDWYVDIMTANLVNKSIRNRFQVFVLPNLYGDIITDEAAQIQGGVGTAGSANIGDRYAMFEAIHGTAPRLIEEGKGDYANPISLMKAACMMLRHIGFTDKAQKLEEALNDTPHEETMTAKEYTDKIIRKMQI